MNMKRFRDAAAIIVLGLALTLCSCATSPEPYDYGFGQDLPTGPGELKKGPGLFSGEDGVFKAYGQPASQGEDSAKKKEDF
jgi:predicted small secreted protein